MDTRHLLILDLDETLVHATRVPLQRDPDALIPPYVLYLRPGVEAFLKRVGECYRLAIWTSSSPMYARVVSEILFPDPEVLEFVWARDRCTPRRDFELDIWWDSKPLHKVRRRGYDLGRVVAIDDNPQKYTRSYGNLVTVAPFTGDPLDDELSHLATYLEKLAREPDVRRIEKRQWRRRMLAQ